MIKTLLSTSVLVLALLFTRGAHAEDSGAKPINLSLFTPIQIFPAEASIHGFRFSLIYGVNHEMHGFGQSSDGQHAGPAVGHRQLGREQPQGSSARVFELHRR